MPVRDQDYDRIHSRQDDRELERKYGEEEPQEVDPDEQRDALFQEICDVTNKLGAKMMADSLRSDAAIKWPEIPTLEPLDCEVVQINLDEFRK